MSGSPLPLSYRRLPRDPGDSALDAITVDPRCSGQLHLPGTYSNLAPPPAYRYRITPTGDHGVEASPVQTGSSREYVVKVDIQNHRDSALTVRLYWVREPELPDTDPPSPPRSEAGPAAGKTWLRRARTGFASSPDAIGLHPDQPGVEHLDDDPLADGSSVSGLDRSSADPSPEEEADRVLDELSDQPSRPALPVEATPFPEDQIAEMIEEANDVDH